MLQGHLTGGAIGRRVRHACRTADCLPTGRPVPYAVSRRLNPPLLRPQKRSVTLCQPTAQTTTPCVARRAKHPKARSTHRRKNIPLYRNSELSYKRNTPVHEKGRSYVVTNRGPGCGGRGQRRREMWSTGRAED